MDASCNILQPILIIFAGLCCIIILISKFLFRLSVNPSEFSSWLQWNFSAVLYNYMYFMVSLIDEAYIHPGLSDLHDEAAGNEIRPEWFWKQLSNLSNAIIKVVIDEARWWNSYSTLHWEPYSGLCFIFFSIWKITVSGGEYPCGCKLSRLSLNQNTRHNIDTHINSLKTPNGQVFRKQTTMISEMLTFKEKS